MNTKPYIQDLISEYAQETGLARLETRNGQGGVLFLDENEFIPWRDLGYNETYGFYRLSAFPNVENQAQYGTWTIHPVITDDGWRPYALLGPDGYGFLLGERWEVAELLPVLQDFLEKGLMAEPIDENDESLGRRWLTINEACIEANNYDPKEYPMTTDDERNRLADRIRQAARRGSIQGYTQDNQGRYKFYSPNFRAWLVKNRQRRG